MVTTVLIVGVARGGTSMTTGLVNSLGVYVPHIVTPKQLEFNPKGNFENFFECEGITKKLNIALFKPEYDEQTPGFLVDQLVAEYGARINKMFVEDNAKGRNAWGFKAPGNNPWILPFFLKAISNIKIVHVRRNIEDNAESYKKLTNDRLTLEQARYDVLRARRKLDQVLSEWEGPRFDVGFYALKRNPHRYVKDLADFLGIQPPSDVNEKLESLIDKKWSTIGKL